MTYTGNVTVGGPADVRELPGLTITKVATPPFENNCYLLRCTSTGETLLVDAAGDAPRLLELVGDVTPQVIHLEGHTPGSVALLYDADPEQPHLWSGDSLFPGGPGNTNKDPERFGRLMDDLERKVFGPLPDATWVYPGHGKDTTLGAERPSVPEWRERGW